MFWKKNCKRCGKKIEKNFDYCPYCGNNFKEGYNESNERDYGFLGKTDIPDNNLKLPFGFNFLFKNLMKEMDKQFRELDREIGKERIQKNEKREDKQKISRLRIPFSQAGGISINISSGAGEPIVKVRSFGNVPEFQELEDHVRKEKREARKPKTIKMPEYDEEKAKKLSKLPRQEAESKVRRLSGKVVYEINLPGVKNENDVVINELENSIEVKAFAKDKAYFKFLPISLPLLKYKLLKEKLILELGER